MTLAVDSAIATSSFTRKPFPVEAIRVTYTNMLAVAAWCNGFIEVGEKDDPYIKVGTRSRHRRQTMAFKGDWVVEIGGTYKIYTDQAFSGAFDQTGG